jgi:hypothetical protein
VLTVTPTRADIEGGAFVKLKVSIRKGDGLVASPAGVLWSSADPRIARVSNEGLVEGKGVGQARIDASWQGATGSAWVRVKQAMKPIPSQPVCLEQAPVPRASSRIPNNNC